MKIFLQIKKSYLKKYIQFIRFARSRKWIKEPKRSYTYKGHKFSYYKWPTHASSEGRLYCKPDEMMDSVYFWKIIDKLHDKFDPFNEHLTAKQPLID